MESWSLEELLGEVSVASGRAVSLSAVPATATVLHRSDIVRSGARSVPELLRQVPGVQVQLLGNGAYLVNMRGMAGLQDNNVVVMVDGHPLNDPLDGSVDWAAFPLHLTQIERIEVVRGSVSVLYGANAYAGVVDVVTRRDAPPSASVETTLATNGGVSAGLAASASGSDGDVRWSFGATGRSDSTATLEDASEAVHSMFAGWMSAGLTRSDWQVRADVAAGEVTATDFGHLSVEPVPVRRPFVRWMAVMDATGRGGRSRVSLWTRGRVRPVRAELPGEAAFSRAGSDTRIASVGVDLGVDLGPNVVVDFGTGMSGESVDAPFIVDKERNRWRGTFSARSSLEWRPSPALTTHLGVRTDVSPFIHEPFPSLRAGVVWDLGAPGTVRLVGQSGFRRPTWIEAVGEFRDADGLLFLEGNPQLDPQRLETVELGWTGSIGNRVVVRPTGYLTRISDVISEDFDSVVHRGFGNTVGTPGPTLTGLELDGRAELSDALVLAADVALLHWLYDGYDTGFSTVGDSRQASRWSTGFAVHGMPSTWLSYRVDGRISGPRLYRVWTGIPPLPFRHEVPTTAVLSASLDIRPSVTAPVWVFVKGSTTRPRDVVEGPYPGGAHATDRVALGVEVR